MVPLVVLTLFLVSFGDARLLNHEFTSKIGTIEEEIHRMYGNNLTNFENTLAFINHFDGSVEKIAAFKAMVGAMKDSDHLYSQEIMQFAQKLKEFVDESNLSKTDQEQIEDIKNILPGSVKTMYFCSTFKLKQKDLNQYLHASMYVHDISRRYLFFTENPNELGTDFEIVEVSTYHQGIRNTWTKECLEAMNIEPYLVELWMPSKHCTFGNEDWAIELVHGTDYVMLRNRYYNTYMYDSGIIMNGGRVPKHDDYPSRSYLWHLQCS
jgi:hypothetical protein